MFSELFDTQGFPPRWRCGSWSDLHGWVHIVSDSLIFGAYIAIPILITYFVFQRSDIRFLKIYWLFAGFIFSCGFGHLIEATIFWHPWYRFSGLIKICTAVVSWATVLALIPALPRALELPGLAPLNEKLQDKNEELESFARHLTDREDRVIELKKEVNALLEELGRSQKYLRDVSS
ncbi:vacuolar protein sorting family 37 protein [Stieleria varia]|uniref:Ethylene receptor 1-like N-terminal domain-containing protein n=1 Tax=Stieleria varia TaxID=2528005 RepID=A0A5C6AWT1_9BACT|nr:hypothetical protein [Stieleria varia]TWU04475.1 hypothetical protein Pla52n_25160 [Stieleria varia]